MQAPRVAPVTSGRPLNVMDASITVPFFLVLAFIISSISCRVSRCFENTDCVPNDVCINYSCYEIKTYEESCSFDEECSPLNRKLVCKNGTCDCQQPLIWIWSISKCRSRGYCQIEEDCPGTDYKCNYTMSRCLKINPIKSRAKKLTRSSSSSSRCTSLFILQIPAITTILMMYISL